jgi:hypothetical protein
MKIDYLILQLCENRQLNNGGDNKRDFYGEKNSLEL